MLPFNEQNAAEDLDASCNKSSDMLRSRYFSNLKHFIIPFKREIDF